jgi:hypothetical protein
MVELAIFSASSRDVLDSFGLEARRESCVNRGV